MNPKKIHLFTDQRKQEVFEAALAYTGREDLTPDQLAPVFSLLEWIRSNPTPEGKTEGLQRCPFCGNISFLEKDPHAIHIKASERSTTGYGLHSDPFTVYYVSCGRCGARSRGVQTGHNALTGTTTSAEQARQRAIDSWNRRAAENPN